MQRNFLFLGIVGLALGLIACRDKISSSAELVYEVDPMIGTDWVGNTYPGASSPFGMVQLSPDNGLPGWDRIAGYYYPDSTIAGFSHTHLSGTGAGDMYDISFMPTIAPVLRAEAPLGVHAKFSHANEEAHAGYYSVLLEPYNIRVELTSTPRVGVQRYTFNQASDLACITLDLHKAMNWDRCTDSKIDILALDELQGYRHSDGWARDQKLFFYTKLSRPADSVSLEQIRINDEAEGKYGYIAKLHYRVQSGDQIVITTALSGVDNQGAKSNHQEEAKDFDFDRYHREARSAWNARLGRIQVSGATAEQRRTLYTSLYHAHLCPTLYSDVDGRYLGADKEVHQIAQGQKHYSTFSLWDTYRAAHPLYNIIAPEDNRDMVQSMVDFGHQNQGYLPVWNMFACETDMMIGYHSVPVIVEAILRGVYTPADANLLTALLRSTAERWDYRGLGDYQALGYVPADKHEESLSKTLEYAYDDAAIAAWGRHIGDSTLYNDYKRRAGYYANLWDQEMGFFRPRLSDGSFKSGFNPFEYSKDVTESNAYQYLMSVQHDVDGLMERMGGVEGLAKRLDDFFASETPKHIELPIFSTGMIGQYVHGNEPGHHVIFLYNKARQPWRTAELVREVCHSLYTDKPNGLCGNEDCGQMSAWYVFASMGFYPIDPVQGQYELTAPLWSESRINLPNGKVFTITAKGLSEQKRYIKSLSINGQPYKKSYITYDQIMSGANLSLEMTDERGVCWYE
ncbi:MAG: GH92 family glycosyl hydrolase [Porphyromonadaceae bacterium]|nr:GH92 family glycosyl hydrolase [Porphyromonadaceae bacterium]